MKRHGLKRTDDVLIAVLGEQILQRWQADQLVESLPFSRSKKLLSCEQDSLGTPWGLHEVAAKHGDGQPAGMVMVGREPIGERWQDRPDAGPDQPCLVTTRILRLRGLEPGLNAGPGVDSFERYIYIHGTNKPERFPENISAGCLLMLDEPLTKLYERIAVGTHVFIFKT
nr:L,D-transpeptidase [Oceanipulchritudo coccoides]